MFSKLENSINTIIGRQVISVERKLVLEPLIKYIQKKCDEELSINLNFICTHNSRRSHFAQIWAQVASSYYNLKSVSCFSGGVEVTSLYAMVYKTIIKQGFQISLIESQSNPIFAIKYAENALPIIGFSKKYNDQLNPSSKFAAILTCTSAEENCPVIDGAELRIAIAYEDPKFADDTSNATEIYLQKSIEIAAEIFYVCSKITTQ